MNDTDVTTLCLLALLALLWAYIKYGPEDDL